MRRGNQIVLSFDFIPWEYILCEMLVENLNTSIWIIGNIYIMYFVYIRHLDPPDSSANISDGSSLFLAPSPPKIKQLLIN